MGGGFSGTIVHSLGILLAILATSSDNNLLSMPSRNVLSAFRGQPAVPLVLHRGQPSRLPFGALVGGLDGARRRCGGRTVIRGMAGLFWRGFRTLCNDKYFVAKRTLLLGGGGNNNSDSATKFSN